MYHLIQVQAVNRPGILHRITQIVLRNQLNIENLSLMVSENTRLSFITLGIIFPEENNEHEAELLAKQMAKQVDIVSAQLMKATPLA